MDRDNDEVALLVAQGGPLNGQRWALHDSFILGRDAYCDVVIPDRQVSRNHARLSITPEGIIIEDLGSKNGTHINGKSMEGPAYLQDGDMIQIALAQKFIFLSSDATLPLESDYQDLQTEYMGSVPIQPQEKEQPSHRGPRLVEAEPLNRLRIDKRAHRIWIRIEEHNPLELQLDMAPSIHEIEVDPPLSASQFKMLEILYDEQGRIVSRQELINGVWGEDEAIGVSEQALDALIRRLRDRLAEIDPTHNYIVTVRGHGLRLDNPAD